MNLPNKCFHPFFAAAVLLAGLFFAETLDAQSAKPKKKTKIEIPESVHVAPISQNLIDKRIEAFSDWMLAPYPSDIGKDSVVLRNKELTEAQKELQKVQLKEFRNKKKKNAKNTAEAPAPQEKPKDLRTVTLSYDGFRRSIMGLRILVSSAEMLDDIEEVTEVRRAWYQDLAKAAEAAGPIVEKLSRARQAGNQANFEKYYKDFKEAAREYKRLLNGRKPKLSSEMLDQLIIKNNKRRDAAYLANLKKEAEKAKAAKEQKEKTGTEDKK